MLKVFWTWLTGNVETVFVSLAVVAVVSSIAWYSWHLISYGEEKTNHAALTSAAQIKEKQDAIQAARPDDAALFDSLRRGKF